MNLIAINLVCLYIFTKLLTYIVIIVVWILNTQFGFYIFVKHEKNIFNHTCN